MPAQSIDSSARVSAESWMLCNKRIFPYSLALFPLNQYIYITFISYHVDEKRNTMPLFFIPKISIFQINVASALKETKSNILGHIFPLFCTKNYLTIEIEPKLIFQ